MSSARVPYQFLWIVNTLDPLSFSPDTPFKATFSENQLNDEADQWISLKYIFLRTWLERQEYVADGGRLTARILAQDILRCEPLA